MANFMKRQKMISNTGSGPRKARSNECKNIAMHDFLKFFLAKNF